ncbi:MAG: vitamin K epoxide reductase family protein [bacterium]|nr:vitamin K epoxide reductase family protein [bacterium]
MTRHLKIAAIIFLIISALGFLDAAYLAIDHYRGNIPPCTIQGCEIVLTSAQSKIAGVPVALLGALYYFTLLILSIAYLDKKNEALIKIASKLTPLGFVASLYFVYLQFFTIKAICQYCMVSATTSTLLFITGMYVIVKMRHKSGASTRI